MSPAAGRPFLQIPGPTNIPERILRAIARPIIDHRGAEFSRMVCELLADLRDLFGSAGHVVIYPSSGSGALEAALVNVLSPGDTVLVVETGHFAVKWADLARRLGFAVRVIPGDWRHPVDQKLLAEYLSRDNNADIKAVAIVHNETSTGTTSDVAAVRNTLDSAGHPALLIVDTISSLASMEYRHDDWSVDVTVCSSQKGLMLPPGLGFNVMSERALEISRNVTMPKGYWDWGSVIEANQSGVFPYTPATNLLFGLQEALLMLKEEGIEHVFSRHARLSCAVRAAVQAWGLEIVCKNISARSNTLTAVMMPDGYDGDEYRQSLYADFGVSLGGGLGKLKGRVIRIGHLGDLNEASVMGTLCSMAMELTKMGVPFHSGGVSAAMDSFLS